jgi:hypothetical protein
MKRGGHREYGRSIKLLQGAQATHEPNEPHDFDGSDHNEHSHGDPEPAEADRQPLPDQDGDAHPDDLQEQHDEAAALPGREVGNRQAPRRGQRRRDRCGCYPEEADAGDNSDEHSGFREPTGSPWIR